MMCVQITFATIRQRLAQLVGILAAAGAIIVIVEVSSALAQPLTCPAGTHLYQGSRCCDSDTPPGPDGQCHSMCPAGSPLPNDPINEAACAVGLAPQQDPANWNDAATVCWDGSNPAGPVWVTVRGIRGFNVDICPRPPGAVCSLGEEMVPVKSLPPAPPGCVPCQPLWTDWTCALDPFNPYYSTACLTPSRSQFPYSANQCCPNGQMPDLAAPGTCIACPPGQITVMGYCCPHNYKPGPGHWGGCVPVIPRRELPPPVTVVPSLPGPPPEVITPRYVPSYLPERRRHRPATPQYRRERPSTVTPSYRSRSHGPRPERPSYSPNRHAD